jgi:tetratricopeptide (TPR) repeat protein
MRQRILCAGLLLFLLSSVSIAGVGLFQQAWDHAWQGEYQAAVKGYLKFAKANTGHDLAPVALFNAASIHQVEMEDLDAAEGGFQELLSRYPDTKWAAEAYSRLAEIALTRDDVKSAVDHYRQALMHSSGDDYRMPDTWIAGVMGGCRESLADLDDPVLTVEIYEDISAYIPSGDMAAEAAYSLAAALKATDRDGEAAHELVNLMDRYPNSSYAGAVIRDDRDFVNQYHDYAWEDLELLRQGEQLYRQGQYEQARDIFEDIYARYQGNPLSENAGYRMIGAEVHLMGDFDIATGKLQAYIDEYPDGVLVQAAGEVLTAYEEIQQFQDLLDFDPEDYTTHERLGRRFMRLRFFDQAVEHLEKATTDTALDVAHLSLGYAYLNMGNPEEGIAAFERYLLKNPDDGNTYNRVGYAYLGLGQMEEALKCFERYRELEPDNPNSHDSYAECLMTMGRMDEAISEYQRAIEINPDFTNPYFMLGNIFREQNDTEKALEYYREYLNRDPSGFLSTQARTAVDSLSQR